MLDKKINSKFWCFVFFCLTLVILINSTRLVYFGLHNADLSYNYCVLSERIEERYEIDLPNVDQIGDETNKGYMSYNSLYNQGFLQITKGFMGLFLSMLFFGFSIYFLLHKK